MSINQGSVKKLGTDGLNCRLLLFSDKKISRV